MSKLVARLSGQNESIIKADSMGLIDLISGGTPQKIEQKADAYVATGAYGQAKIEYEKALARLVRRPEVSPGYRSQLEDKLQRCKESLACDHRREGAALIKAGCPTEARELLDLALELTADANLAADVEALIANIPTDTDDPETFDFYESATEVPILQDTGSDEEYFEALCNALEDEEKAAYRSYPDNFKAGFVALNRGDFDTAVPLLTEAAQAYPFGANYITLELATAHLNQGDHETARTRLEGFIADYPDSLRAYHLMCEILWEAGTFGDALKLLSTCPPSLAELLPTKMLTGETFMRAGQFEQAADFFQHLLADFGWDSQIAQALSGAYEAQGRYAEARNLYGEIMGTCTGCGIQVDPRVKQRYAETSFTTGDHSTKILELYLELVREDPANRQVYYRRISHIYKRQGNDHESRRFASFARQAVLGSQVED